MPSSQAFFPYGKKPGVLESLLRRSEQDVFGARPLWMLRHNRLEILWFGCFHGAIEFTELAVPPA